MCVCVCQNMCMYCIIFSYLLLDQCVWSSEHIQLSFYRKITTQDPKIAGQKKKTHNLTQLSTNSVKSRIWVWLGRTKTDLLLFPRYFYSHNQPARSVQSSLYPEPLSWPAETVEFDRCPAVLLTTTFHRRLLYTFNTRGFPLCPLLSSAACDLTLEIASVSNKGHCLTWIGMLVWTTGICLCLVHPLSPPWESFCSIEY